MLDPKMREVLRRFARVLRNASDGPETTLALLAAALDQYADGVENYADCWRVRRGAAIISKYAKLPGERALGAWASALEDPPRRRR